MACLHLLWLKDKRGNYQYYVAHNLKTNPHHTTTKSQAKAIIKASEAMGKKVLEYKTTTNYLQKEDFLQFINDHSNIGDFPMKLFDHEVFEMEKLTNIIWDKRKEITISCLKKDCGNAIVNVGVCGEICKHVLPNGEFGDCHYLTAQFDITTSIKATKLKDVDWRKVLDQRIRAVLWVDNKAYRQNLRTYHLNDLQGFDSRT